MSRRKLGFSPITQSMSLRMVMTIGILFFAAIQFRSLIHLFGSSSGGDNDAAAWSPYNFDRPTQPSGATIGAPNGRRVIYQCTCEENYYWNVDLGRAKQWRRALRRINDLVPEIETIEFVLDINTTDTCEELILKDMMDSTIDAYEIIYSPWYRHSKSKLDLSKLNMSESDGNGHVRHIRDWGETFHGRDVRCDPNDNSTIHFSHSNHLMAHQKNDCAIVHGSEIIDWATMIADYRQRNETVPDLLTRRLSKDEAMAELEQKEGFVGLVVQSSWKDVYEIDSLVRHALCDLLTEQYKPCEKLVGWKGDVDKFQKRWNISVQFRHDTVPLYKRYKFAIAMNNALWEGYSTEKEINPYLANSIAVVGTPDYPNMANAHRVVHCTIAKEVLEDAGRWARKESFMPFNTTPEDWERDPTIKPIPWDLWHDEGLMQFAKDKFGEALKPCIAEIIRLDRDDDAYIEKLTEPFIVRYENSIFDGTYVAVELLRWLNRKASQVTAGLSSLGNVRVDEQTRSNDFMQRKLRMATKASGLLSWLKLGSGLETNTGNKDDQTSSKATARRKWRSSNSAVIGLAMGYNLESYQIFVGSLRATGFSGHIILGIQPDVPPEISAYLAAHDVTTKEVVIGNCTYYGQKNMDGHVSTEQKCCKAYPDYKIQWARFALARDWLLECTKCTDGVLLTDVRDSFFQSDPFLSASPSPIMLFSDHPNLTIAHWLVKDMIAKCHGDGALRDFTRPHLNSGSTMGSREGIIEYVHAMVQEFDYMKDRENCRSDSKADDQTVHNYVYYTGGLPDSVVLVPHRTGPIHVMAYEADIVFRKRIDQVYARGGFKDKLEAEEWVNSNGFVDNQTDWKNWLGPEHGLTNEAGLILNLDGTPSPQVHQADRFGPFFNSFLRRMNEEVWSKVVHPPK